MCRQDVTDTQKSLEKTFKRLEGIVEVLFVDLCFLWHLLLHSVVRVGETAVTHLAKQTQLHPLGYSLLLKHTLTKLLFSISTSFLFFKY